MEEIGIIKEIKGAIALVIVQKQNNMKAERNLCL